MDGWGKSIPAWSAVILGVIYGTGFLVSYSFLGSIGVRESIEEAFKAKYIYLGVLCLYFPVTFGLLMLGSFYVKSSLFYNPRIYWPTVFTLAIQLISIYVLIAFTDPGFFHHHEGELGWLYTLMIGLTVIRLRESRLDQRQMSPFIISPAIHIGRSRMQQREFIRWLFLVLTLLLAFDIFRSFLFPLGIQILFSATFYLVLLSVAGCIFASIILTRTSGALLIVSLCFPVAILYFSVLIFAYRIYPYIPVSRGGGDYSRGERASILVLDPRFISGFPEDIVDETNSSFSDGDFIDLDGLTRKLSSPGQWDSASRFLWNTMPKETKRIVLDFRLTPEERESVLIESLDEFLRSDRFDRLKSPAEGQLPELLPFISDTSINDRIRRHRLILEASFPTQLRKVAKTEEGSDITARVRRSWPVTILDETATSLFVTLEISKEAHRRWREGGTENKPKEVYCIKRESVTTIVYHREISDLLESK